MASGHAVQGRGQIPVASVRNNGAVPIWPDMVLAKIIRPALDRVGIAKQVGWHTFRHSLGSHLRFLGGGHLGGPGVAPSFQRADYLGPLHPGPKLAEEGSQ